MWLLLTLIWCILPRVSRSKKLRRSQSVNDSWEMMHSIYHTASLCFSYWERCIKRCAFCPFGISAPSFSVIQSEISSRWRFWQLATSIKMNFLPEAVPAQASYPLPVVKPCSSMQVPRLSWKEKQAIESDTWIISAVFFSYSGSPILDISWHDVTEINKNILAKYVVFFVIDNFFAIFSNKICNYSNIYVYIYFFSQVLQVWNPGLSFQILFHR